MEAAAKADALRVAVDVGGTFTDIFVFDESGGDARGSRRFRRRRPTRWRACSTASARPASTCDKVGLFSHGTTVATNALLTRRFPKVAMVTTRGLPRRDRDPARHEGRPLGRLQGRRAAVRAPPRPVRGARARRLRRPGHRAARRGRGAARGRDPAPPRGRDGGGLLHQRLREPRERAADARAPRGGAARRRRSPRRARCCPRSSSTSASRPRSRTPCSRRSSAATCAGSASGWPRAATTATCCCCTRAAA